MKKILLLSLCSNFRGAEKLELDWIRNLYNNKDIKIDLLSPVKNTFIKYEDEIRRLNVNLYDLNVARGSFKNKVLYLVRLYKFLKKNKYDVIHINYSAILTSFQVAFIAKMCKIKKIIVHSHTYYDMKIFNKILLKVLNPIYCKLFDVGLACSNSAIKTLFTPKTIIKKDVKVLKNGIEINKYMFDEMIRNKYIKEFELENKIIYGHIGGFAAVKNHSFLIDLFYEIQKKQENAVLLLIGEGALKQKIKEKVEKLNIEDKVIFLGFREDANYILNCMDVFLFPSINEGFGIALVEAQTNGLPVFCSYGIPIETKITDRFYYFDLKDDICKIAEKICNEKINMEDRKGAYKNTIENGYDIKNTCQELEKIYLSE